MTRANGIAETISDFLTEKGIGITKEELDQLAEDIDYGCQMWDETAYALIPNPMIAEVDKIKQYRKEDQREHDREVERLRDAIQEWKRDYNRLVWKLEEARAQGFRD